MTQPPICTADLYDLHNDLLRVCETQFRSFGGCETFFGPCETVATFEDHTPVLRALETEGRGRILVVDGQGSMKVGLMGDRLAEIGAANGWRGVIVNGVIRDSAGIDALSIGVRALGTTARRGWTSGPSSQGKPVSFGGVTLAPGDWVYADRDCVIVAASELPIPT
ncbi:MAG: ribonuclease E activity regulator RraA [Paracoccaceae bacterium]